MPTAVSPAFQTGPLAATPGAINTFTDRQLAAALTRHVAADWTDMPAEDQHANREAIRLGGRIFGSYLIEQQTVWIITEADRSVTTILLPEEY